MTNDVLNGYVCPTCEGVGCPDCHKTGVRQDRRKIAEVVGSNPTPSTTPTDEFSEGVKISIMHGDRELGNFTLHDTVAKHLLEGKEIEGYIGGFDDSIPCFTTGNFYKRKSVAADIDVGHNSFHEFIKARHEEKKQRGLCSPEFPCNECVAAIKIEATPAAQKHEEEKEILHHYLLEAVKSGAFHHIKKDGQPYIQGTIDQIIERLTEFYRSPGFAKIEDTKVFSINNRVFCDDYGAGTITLPESEREINARINSQHQQRNGSANIRLWFVEFDNGNKLWLRETEIAHIEGGAS